MTKKPSNLITVGRITGVFGVKGWLKVKSWTEPEERIVEYSPWWLKTHHGVKQIEITDTQVRTQGVLVRLKGVDDRDAAKEYSSVEIAIDKSQLPELTVGEYYWHQLQGLQVISVHNSQEHCLGCVEKLMETGANDVLVVKPTVDSMDDKARLVPYVPGVYVISVDLEAQKVTVDWDPDF